LAAGISFNAAFVQNMAKIDSELQMRLWRASLFLYVWH